LGDEAFKEAQRKYMEVYRSKAIELNDLQEIDVLLEKYGVKNTTCDDEWLAGFIDGDGSVSVIDERYLKCEIEQCDPIVLLKIQHKYGGVISKRLNSGENARPIYKLTLACNYSRSLLENIANHVIIEKQKIDACMEYFQAFDNAHEEQVSIAIDKIRTKTKSSGSNYERICDSYIAGLFDAEGEVGLTLSQNKTSAKYSISITQKLDIDLLTRIKEHFGYGKVGNVRFIIYKKDHIIDFIKRVIRYVVVKKRQCEYMLQFFDNKLTLKDAIDAIKQEKHKVVDISKELRTCVNNARIKLKKPNTEKQIQKHKEWCKLKSEQMKGPGNPNFNKPRSKTHLIHQKQGCTLARIEKVGRKVTDEQILEIRALYASGTKPQAIADKFKLSRQYATNIAKGKILTKDELTNEEKIVALLEQKHQVKAEVKAAIANGKSSKALGLEKSVKGRRKLPVEVILQIMESKIKNPDQSVRDVLSIYKNQYPAITEWMVKNYHNGKILMFENEFPIATYTWEDFQRMQKSLQRN